MPHEEAGTAIGRHDDPPVAQAPRHIASLTSLRFFAAAMIVVLHTSHMLHPHPFLGRMSLERGVSFFFVLSGFILYYTYGGGALRVRDFLVARAARIWPAHAAVLGLWFLLFLPYSVDLFLEGENPLVFLCNLLLVQAWIPTPRYYLAFNVVTWSLCVEMLFYLLFPVMLPSFSRAWGWMLGAAVAAEVALVLVAQSYGLPLGARVLEWQVTAKGLLNNLPLARVSEFVLGMVAARFTMRFASLIRLDGSTATAVELAVIAMTIASLFVTGDTITSNAYASYHLHAVLSAPFFAVLIATCFFGRGMISRFLGLKPLVLLGHASYALYLLHDVLLTFLAAHEPAARTMVPVPMWLAYWLILIAASLALHAFVERPARMRIRALLTAGRIPA